MLKHTDHFENILMLHTKNGFFLQKSVTLLKRWTTSICHGSWGSKSEGSLAIFCFKWPRKGKSQKLLTDG